MIVRGQRSVLPATVPRSGARANGAAPRARRRFRETFPIERRREQYANRKSVLRSLRDDNDVIAGDRGNHVLN